MGARLLLSVLVAVALAVFAVQNAAAVPLRYPGGVLMASLALIIIASAALGALLTLIFIWVGAWSRKRRRGQHEELRRLREELAAARAQVQPQPSETGSAQAAPTQERLDKETDR